MRTATVGPRPESAGAQLPVAAALSDVGVLDAAEQRDLHAAYKRLRRSERVSWPCPCFACSPKPIRISVRPTGPTMFDITRLVREYRARGLRLEPDAARSLLGSAGRPNGKGGVVTIEPRDGVPDQARWVA